MIFFKNLWGSFELKLDALQRMQIMQLRHMTFEEALSDENLDSTQEMFKNLNMKALNVEAISMDYQTLEKKLIRAVEELNVEHIIIDNLQFLLYGGDFKYLFHISDCKITFENVIFFKKFFYSYERPR